MKYQTLIDSIKSRGIKKTAIARHLGITERALRYKLQGASPFTWEQACSLQAHFFPDLELKSLFRSQPEERLPN